MPNYTNQYFTIRSRENGNTINFKIGSSNMTTIATSISYSTDNGVTWSTEGVVDNKTVSVYVNSGDTVMWKGIANSWCYSDVSYNYGSTFTASKFFDVEGNIMSLLYGNDFADKTVFVSNNTFAYLFSESTKLVNAENLVLPATTLRPYCYRTMFQNCYALQTSPKELPATTLVESCYRGMFQYCSGMTTTPFLPDATLASNSCLNLFRYCSGITSVVCLHSDTSTSYHNSWMNAVASTGTFYKNPNATWSRGTSAVPTNWTIDDYVPYPETASTFTSDGGNATYSLETQATWNAVSDSNWLIVSPISGTGDETLSITVKKNSDYDSGRTGTVTVTDTNDNILLVWTVEQERKKLVIKLMNLWKNGAPINKMMIDEDSRYQSFVNLGAITGNTIEYTTTGGTMIDVPRTGWGSPMISNAYDTNGGKLTFLGQPTQIAPNAFSGSDITTFTVPDSVSAIGANAFAECAEIEEITLGENIAVLGAGAFSGCSNLAYIEAESDTAPSISADTFYGVAEGGTLKHNPGTDYSTWMSDDPYYLGYYGWEEEAEIDYSTKYFTVQSREDNNTVTWRIINNSNIQFTSFSYSLDDGENWTTVTTRGNVNMGTINSGDTILMKGIANNWGWSASTVGNTPILSATGEFNVYGNAMSLVYGDDFSGQTAVPHRNYVFGRLFAHSTKVRDCSNLIFPATKVHNRCYGQMFCGSTVTSLPQMAQVNDFYETANGGRDGIYQWFAAYCTGLTTASLNIDYSGSVGEFFIQCYFRECTNLTAVTGTVKLGTVGLGAFEYMFYGSNALTKVPDFFVDQRSNSYPFRYMFYGCSSLANIKWISDITSTSYYDNWVTGVAANGTFTKKQGITMSTGNSGIPSNWTVVDYTE